MFRTGSSDQLLASGSGCPGFQTSSPSPAKERLGSNDEIRGLGRLVLHVNPEMGDPKLA